MYSTAGVSTQTAAITSLPTSGPNEPAPAARPRRHCASQRAATRMPTAG
ncbi:MAG: hypothetical protein BWZ02_02468 [Lentisphaerae bacterium ADurb.BinA184]|nr:MAG: hypothetical protein BWZ02_02468 [Lentisphaerae bacterium ADurb.BinA184]